MFDNQIDLIHKNIQFILSHFSGQEFMFPRSIMTSKSNGQVFVDSEDEMIALFSESNFIDCRINGYPFHHQNECRKLYPSFIFIDLDLSLCSSCKYPIRKLDYILKQTLKKIKEEINGHPTVFWTGGGYHIYQPIKIVTKDQEKYPLESIEDFKEYAPFIRSDLTTEFIRFGGKYLTNDKGDPKHNPSIYSCLIRFPGTVNSKYNERVEIHQEWDGIEAMANSLLSPFMNHLKQCKVEMEEIRKSNKINSHSKGNEKQNIVWIEKLLQTPIADHRYFCLWHILIPYLKNLQGLSDNQVISTVTEWLDKCSKVNGVRWRYPQRIKEQLRYDKGYPPISLENLKKENYELFLLLQK